jgi:hypothetical protein
MTIHANGARSWAGVAHDPVRNKWLYIADADAGGGGAGVQTVRTSTDRTTWSTPAGTTGSTSIDTLGSLACNKGTGRIVYAAKNGASTFRIRYTDDCGTSFTSVTDITFSLTSPTYAALTWSEAYNKFFLVISKSTAAEVWTSSTGATWTRICQLSTVGLRRIASYGSILVAQGFSVSGYTPHCVSVDGGATWRVGAFVPPGAAVDAFRTAYGFVSLLAATGGAVDHSFYFSLAMGLPQGTVLT